MLILFRYMWRQRKKYPVVGILTNYFFIIPYDHGTDQDAESNLRGRPHMGIFSHNCILFFPERIKN